MTYTLFHSSSEYCGATVIDGAGVGRGPASPMRLGRFGWIVAVGVRFAFDGCTDSHGQ